MLRFKLRWLAAVVCLSMLSASLPVWADEKTSKASEVVDQIKDEGLNRSQVMQTLSYLSDVIGARLTASPNAKRANEWTRQQLEKWGCYNAHLESWGPFGRGWSIQQFAVQVVEPQGIPLIAYPKAWSPGLKGTLTGDVVFLDAKTEADLDKYKGKLKGAIVLSRPITDVRPHFTPQGTRWTDEQLSRMAAATGGDRPRPNRPAGQPGQQAQPGQAGQRPAQGRFQMSPEMIAQRQLDAKKIQFLLDEGAAVMIEPGRGDGGTVFVQQVSLPGATLFGGGAPPAITPPTLPAGAPNQANPPAANQPPAQPGAANPPAAGQRGNRGQRAAGGQRRPSPWAKDAPKTIPQIVMAAEHYNRLVRMVQAGEKVKLAVDMQVKFHDHDLMSYNTIAEIPGTDLKDEVVMLGAHMDSWHGGTGATDNGAGCAVTMEAMRIIQALNLKPRRTIRIGLWTGEEEGLMGSAAYVKEHFGTLTGGPSFFGGGGGGAAGGNQEPPKLTTKPEYEKLSGYFNLDNGTGKIRGVYLQGNSGVKDLFQEWLTPFKEMGASTITINNTGGTDHQSFDRIGLPGFQFIQDEIEYDSRTHHSNMDVFDRIQADDMKQASVIMAAFVYNTAMRDEKLPRKQRPGSN